MSDNRATERSAMNWRGPLLAAVIFAAVFGTLLLMAHLNQSNSSDPGSSFRQDPYGTSLLFDSYERAGYKVRRSSDEQSLADQDAAETTAFFIGGYRYDYGDTETRNGQLIQGSKFHTLLENFLARGGRVVLLQHDPGVSTASISEPDGKTKSTGAGEKTEKNWGVKIAYRDRGEDENHPLWAAPRLPPMQEGSEPIYLSDVSPWLEIDSQWTPLYAKKTNATEEPGVEPKIENAPTRAYMAKRRVGNGELIMASQESFLLNEAIKTHPNPVLLDFLGGGRSVIWVDETLHGLHQNQGVLWLVQRYRLPAALLLFWATLLALLWSMSGDLVRRPSPSRGFGIVRHSEAAGVAAQRLLQRSIAPENVVAECWELFRRRAPQDARAISEDPSSRPRLRTALQLSPLAGYQELRILIAERRSARKGSAGSRQQELTVTSTASPKTTPEEGRVA
jgi:hypothetical protein